MRKLRDYDAELKALTSRTHALKCRRIIQLGELVVAAGADALPVDELAGALLEATAVTDQHLKEAWRAAGPSFFLRANNPSRRSRRDGGEPAADESSAQSAALGPGAA